jgi:hypothetical protein
VSRRGVAAAAVLVAGLVPVLLSGCSTDRSGSDAPALGDVASGGVGAEDDSLTCLAEKGYPMPDPESPVQHIKKPDAVDQEQWDEDTRECGVSGSRFSDATSTNEEPDADIERKMGECVREAGIDDYPDSIDDRVDFTVKASPEILEILGECSKKVSE